MLIYSNSTKTATPILGTISYMMMTIIKRKFPPNFFQHTYIDTRNVSIDRKKQRKYIYGYKLPAIAFKPSFVVDDSLFIQREMQLIPRNIFFHNDYGIKASTEIKRMRINYEIKLKLETRMKMNDTLIYMMNKFPFNNYVSSDFIPVSFPLPNDFIEILMALLGFEENINSIRSFTTFLNQHSRFTFNYAKNLGTGNYNFFINMPVSFTIYFDGIPQAEFGNKNNVTADNYINFNCYIEFWYPATYKIFGEMEKVNETLTLLKRDKIALFYKQNNELEYLKNLFKLIENKKYSFYEISEFINPSFLKYLLKLKSIYINITNNTDNNIDDNKDFNDNKDNDELITDINENELIEFPSEIKEFLLTIKEKILKDKETLNSFDYEQENLILYKDENKKNLKTYKSVFERNNTSNILHPNNPNAPNYNPNEDIDSLESLYNPVNPKSPFNPYNIHNPLNNLNDLILDNFLFTGNIFKEPENRKIIDSDISKLILDIFIKDEIEKVYKGKDLIINEEFIVEINTITDKLDIYDIFTEEQRMVINYVIDNYNINDLIELRLYCKGENIFINKNLFYILWKKYKLIILKPLVNVVYNILVYINTAMYEQILKEIKKN